MASPVTRGAQRGGSDDEGAVAARAHAVPVWTAIEELKEIRRMNLQVIEHLAMLLRDLAPSVPLALRVLARHSGDMDLQVLKTLAQVPVLLLDLRFSDATWWESALDEPRSADEVGNSDVIPAAKAGEWSREILMLAFPLAKRNMFAAKLHLGMTEYVARRIRGLNIREINRISEQHAHCLRLRCFPKPVVWRHLVGDAIAQRGSTLHRGRCVSITTLSGAALRKS